MLLALISLQLLILACAACATLNLAFRATKLALATVRTSGVTRQDFISTAVWYLKMPFLLSLAAWTPIALLCLN